MSDSTDEDQQAALTKAQQAFTLLYGDLGQRDIDKGVELLEQSGNRYALAAFYINGIAIEPDYKKAARIYTEGIALGQTACIDGLAQLCELGLGVEKDEGKAFALINETFNESGDLGSNVDLARYYEQGIGTEINYEMACGLYKRCVSVGNKLGIYKPEAFAGLSRLYRGGLGVMQSTEKADDYHHKAMLSSQITELQDKIFHAPEHEKQPIRDQINQIKMELKPA